MTDQLTDDEVAEAIAETGIAEPAPEQPSHVGEMADITPPDRCAVALALAWQLRTEPEGATRATLGWAVVGIALETETGAAMDAARLGTLARVKPSTASSMLRDLARLGVLRKHPMLDPKTQRPTARYTVAEPERWGME